MREVFLRDRKVQELTERSPAILHLEDEESVWWDLPLNLLPPLKTLLWMGSGIRIRLTPDSVNISTNSHITALIVN